MWRKGQGGRENKKNNDKEKIEQKENMTAFTS